MQFNFESLFCLGPMKCQVQEFPIWSQRLAYQVSCSFVLDDITQTTDDLFNFIRSSPSILFFLLKNII